MPEDQAQLDKPRIDILIEPPKRGTVINFGELWEFRELLQQMVWRDLTVRYKQTALGVGWAVLAPLVTVAIFTLIFGLWGRLPTDGIPAPVFYLTGLMLYSFSSSALLGSSASLLNHRALLTKIYFPRLLAPLSATIVPFIDLLIALVALLALALYEGFAPSWRLVWALPICVIWSWMAALGLGLWLAAMNAYFRDVGQLVPFIARIWMFASPVLYPTSMIPEKWLWLYGLNPLVGSIEWLRWALFNSPVPPVPELWISAPLTTLLLLTGAWFFRRMEHAFADVV